MGAYHLIFRPLLEHLVHVHGGLLQHLIPDMGVDVGGGLVVGVADDFHGHQRVDAALVEHGHVVVPEVMRRQDGLDLLQDVVRTAAARLDLAPLDAAHRQHQSVPHPLEAGLRQRFFQRCDPLDAEDHPGFPTGLPRHPV